MSDIAIRVDRLGKQYRIGSRPKYGTLRDALTSLTQLPKRLLRPTERDDRFWALRDVSFEVKRGEVVGIIGRNGAGKSTLLKILSRITEPTEGEADLFGRVGSLLEVGTGFHPELTGRENIFLNGAILGMRRAEILTKFDEIVAFAEVEKFIDTPVKHFSSGMYMRLAFAVAAHLEPEILIVDEVLAVGDAQFQKKCLGKMGDVAKQGRTVLFVSHNMAALRQLTQVCVLLQAGRVVCVDETTKAIERYLQEPVATAVSDMRSVSLSSYRRGSVCESSVRINSISVFSEDGKPINCLASGDFFRIAVTVSSGESHERACLDIGINNDRGERVNTFFSGDSGFWFPIRKGEQVIQCTVRDLPLAPGRYFVNIGINRNTNTLAFDVILDFPVFAVIMDGINSGEIEWPGRPWGSIHWRNVDWNFG